MPTATVKAFAKINLGLKILGRRGDGFHELRTIYQTISLHDTLEIAISQRAPRPQVRFSASGLDVPSGNDNIAVRAASAMCEALSIKRMVNIRLTKRVPTGGGLGGGSSDAAAVLRALQLLSGSRLPAQKIFQLAAALGSDVPFFLFGGRAIGVGRGEEVYPLPDSSAFHCVLALPEAGMNTGEAYRGLRARPWPPASEPSHEALPASQPIFDTFCTTLLNELNNPKLQASAPDNDFEKLLFGTFPQLAVAKSKMVRSGSVHASLTGSGSAVYGLFKTREQAVSAHQRLKRLGMRLFLTRTVGRRQYAQGLCLG